MEYSKAKILSKRYKRDQFEALHENLIKYVATGIFSSSSSSMSLHIPSIVLLYSYSKSSQLSIVSTIIVHSHP